MATLEPEFRLDEQQKFVLAALSHATGKSWHVVLSEALVEYQKNVQSAVGAGANPVSVADAMRAVGLLGCIQDAPADLSSNPSYMNGFGEHGD
jgi:hypothetical protein